MVIVETSFPRGGTIKPQTEANEINFGARQEKRKKEKSQKKLKTTDNTEATEEIKAVSAELLSHKTIQEGMLVMGCVKVVDATFLKVSMPGRIVGHVLASSISESYNKVMRKYVEGKESASSFKPLTELFSVGQKVYVKVVEIANSEVGRMHINLSLKPTDVHANFNHQSLRKGQLFNGAVEEVQEHGYVIESGVKNLRCFLPSSSLNKTFTVGQLVYMRIEKLTQTSTASTAVCKAIVDGNLKIKDVTDPNLDYLLPTTVVNFTISKILKDGLQGTIMNGLFTAYVNEHQLSEVMECSDDYEPNKTVGAQLLYVMPLTKLVYLSLRTNQVDEEKVYYKRGDIVDEAIVHYIGTGGIVLNLKNKGKGLISFKSIKTNYTGNYDHDELLAKYRKNTKHKVRIMEYDHVDALYTCSDNSIVVNEKFYSLKDLKPGDFLTGVVQEKDQNGGYVIRVGNVRGFIEKMFLSTTGGNLQENAKIRCRVIWTNPDRNVAYLTNRSEYMAKTAKILTELGGVKANRIYTGTIVKTHEKCFIVRFFGNIKAILYRNTISDFMSNSLSSLYAGATMSFRIILKTDEKIVVGLADEIHKMGEICTAKVTNIIQNGLEIVIRGEENDQIKGLVPVRLLSDFPKLIVGHLKTYSLDDELNVGCVIRNIYSIRDVGNFKVHPVQQWKDIKIRDVLKGFIKNVDKDIIEIMVPILNYEKLVKVHMNMFLEHCVSEPNVVLVPDQVVFVKVLSKESITKTLTVSAKLAEVWDCDLKSTGECFARFLSEVKHIRKKFKAHSRPIAMYKIGEQVQGKVISCDPTDNWNVELPNDVRGLIKSAVVGNDKKLKVGKEVKCVILWIDYSTDIVYLSHKVNDIEHITTGHQLPEKFKNQAGINAKILLKMDDFTLCSIKKGQNPIIFVPARLHYNDFESTVAANMKEGEFCRLAFIHERYPIAVLESMSKFWNRLKKANKRSAPEETTVKKEGIAKRIKLLKDDGEKIESKNLKNYVSVIENDDDDSSNLTESSLFFKDTNGKKRIKKQPPNPVFAVIEDEKAESSNDSDEGDSVTDEPPSDIDKRRNMKKPLNPVVAVIEGEEAKSSNDSDEDDIDRRNKRRKPSNPVVAVIDDEEAATSNDSDVHDDDDSEVDEPPKKKILTDTEIWSEYLQQQKIERIMKSKKSSVQVQPLLPGASGFWSTNLDTLNQSTRDHPESSDEDNSDGATSKSISTKKKKKQSVSEKFQAAREEEARLRKIEENYAHPNHQPESADQFDRLVLTDPNNSMTWINYMVFHLQATEIDKARSVARKALKSISFREEKELLNIWVALLNLELRYGTKETFNEILKESTLCNDQYKIYTRCLQILSDAKKIQELNEMIPSVTKKFKDIPDIWKSAASAYFAVGLTEKAKQLLHKALAILPERDHINTIVTFANLNYKNDDKDTAHTLLEQIVTSYPKRVDVWSQYVDMLIKDNEIESARRTLERSVVQKIPIKKMRTLFKKYLEFEEKYGNEESVQNVKEIAANYVKNEINS